MGEQILHVSIIGNVWRTVWSIWMPMYEISVQYCSLLFTCLRLRFQRNFFSESTKYFPYFFIHF